LRGVPALPQEEQFWEITVDRFANPPNTNSFSNGLAALYADRDHFMKDFHPKRLIELTRPRSRMLVTGRTLLKWASLDQDHLVDLARRNELQISFMIASKQALEYLDPRLEKPIVESDLKNVLPFFQQLLQTDQDASLPRFCLYQSDLLILDSITCAEVCFKVGDELTFSRRIALQDINATAQEPAASPQGSSEPVPSDPNAKVAILWRCICPDGIPQATRPCMAHGLYRRTEILFEKATHMTGRDIQAFWA
jgi:hypothetical protein